MSLLCKIFGHKVETVGTNDWQIATHEKCEFCGLSRKMQRIEETNCYQWIYSDGRRSIGVVSKLVSDIDFGELV